MLEPIDELRAFILHRVRKGFESPHEIVENSIAYAYGKFERHFEPEAKQLTAKLLAAHYAEQSGWGPTTDCDRLDEAFTTLNKQGIVSLHNFSCCNNCGFTEIWDEVEKAEKRMAVIGYVFYHLQATDRVIKTGQLLMAFGCIEENTEAFQSVANVIVAELRRVGLNASWGGTDFHPITIEGMVWRRRR